MNEIYGIQFPLAAGVREKKLNRSLIKNDFHLLLEQCSCGGVNLHPDNENHFISDMIQGQNLTLPAFDERRRPRKERPRGGSVPGAGEC